MLPKITRYSDHSWRVFLLEDSRCFPHEFHKCICNTSSPLYSKLCSSKITCCCFSHDFCATTMSNSFIQIWCVSEIHLQPGTFTQKSEVICTLNKNLQKSPDKVKAWQPADTPGPAINLSAHVQHNLWILMILGRRCCFHYPQQNRQKRSDSQRAWQRKAASTVMLSEQQAG